MRKVLKYAVLVVIVAFLMYSGIYFEDLQEVRQLRQEKTFDPVGYARDFWDNKLAGALDGAADVGELIELFNMNMAEAIRRYGKAPGVSRVYAYLLQGEGTIVAVGEDGLQVSIAGRAGESVVLIETGLYIPGNAVRDASGLVDVSEFSDTMKFNEVSSEINKIVVKEVIGPFLGAKCEAGMKIKFIGASQVSQEHVFGQLTVDSSGVKESQLLKIVPIKLELKEP